MDAAIFGLIVADLIAEPMDLRKSMPAPGGLQLVNSITLTTGGNVCNTGVAMAKMGMEVAAAGMVGDDVLGRAVSERLQQAGLNISAVFKSESAQTSATVVAVEPGGERCFFHTPGATPQLDAEVFRKCFAIFRECAYVQIGYFGLLPTLTPHLPDLLAQFRSGSPGTKIALDTVNPPAERKLLVPILPHLDIFCPSRTEAEALSGEKRPAKMVAFFRQFMPRGLIGIKLDSKGCYLDDGSDAVTVPAYKIKVVDSTGAGDTWFAGLLTALRHEMPLEQAGRFANRAAADCCLAIGASTGVKSFEETLARATQ
jgi:sugar/nucleoside kinase (ribokinase family)